MTAEGYAPLSREEITAILVFAGSRVDVQLWKEAHQGHAPKPPLVENLLFQGVRITYRCGCGEKQEIWT